LQCSNPRQVLARWIAVSAVTHRTLIAPSQLVMKGAMVGLTPGGDAISPVGSQESPPRKTHFRTLAGSVAV